MFLDNIHRLALSKNRPVYFENTTFVSHSLHKMFVVAVIHPTFYAVAILQ
jgi:hypothetical protein